MNKNISLLIFFLFVTQMGYFIPPGVPFFYPFYAKIITMNIFGKFLKPNKQTPVQNPNQPNWDSLQNMPFNDEKEPANKETIPPNLRQQDKLIKTIFTGNTRVLNQDSVEVTEEEHEDFLELVANHSITEEHFNNVISHINGPWMRKHPNVIFDEKINGDKHLSRILAYNTDLGFNNYNATTGDSLTKFIKRYPNPADFENASTLFLQMIKNNNTPSKYQEYLESMRNFKHIVYGKKQEYFDQAKALQQEALLKYPQAQPETSNTLKPIESLLKSATFDNDAFIQNGHEYHLTTKHLEQAGLTPHHELIMENNRIGFSNSFKVQGHDACLGYVETPDGKVTVRPYYRSNSAGIWRYMPDYVAEENGEINWFGKGYSEESLTLPFEFQQKLNQIAEQPPANLSNSMPDFFFAGAAHRYTSRDEYLDNLQSGSLRGDFYREVAGRPSYDFGHISKIKESPDQLDITGPISPDFNHQIDASSTYTREYGEISSKLYPSQDHNLRYTMSETEENGELRAWLSGIEVSSSRLTSTGCRAEYASIGDIGTPLHEYRSMADGYGEEIAPGRRYVNMWSNYLSKMPLIRRYLNTINNK